MTSKSLDIKTANIWDKRTI